MSIPTTLSDQPLIGAEKSICCNPCIKLLGEYGGNEYQAQNDGECNPRPPVQ